MTVTFQKILVGTLAVSFSFLAVIVMTAADEGLSRTRESSRGVRLHKKMPNGSDTPAPPNCRKMMMVMAKKQMKNFKACTAEVKELYPGKEEFAKHFQCIIKCALGKEQMLDENFLISNQSVQNFFDKNIPLDYHTVGHKVVGGCLDVWGPKFDPSDATCAAYGDFIKCLQEYVADIC